MSATPQTKILFVCTGGTCRSPMAAIMFQQLCRRYHRTGVQVRSAGTDVEPGMTMLPEAVTALQLYGYRLPKRPHRAQQYTPALAQKFDYIFSLQNYEDPYGRGQDAYNYLCCRLQVDLDALYHQIFDWKNPQPRL